MFDNQKTISGRTLKASENIFYDRFFENYV